MFLTKTASTGEFADSTYQFSAKLLAGCNLEVREFSHKKPGPDLNSHDSVNTYNIYAMMMWLLRESTVQIESKKCFGSIKIKIWIYLDIFAR